MGVVRSGLAGAAAGVCLMVPGSAAWADSRLELGTSLEVSASNNPLLLVGPAGRSALLVEGSVSPSWELRAATATTRASGTLRFRRYSRLYKEFTSGSVELERDGRLSEALSYKGLVSYDRSLTVDVVDDISAAIDPSSLRNRLGGEASLQWRPGLRGEWNVGTNYERVWFDEATTARNYRALGVTAGYFHALSEATRLGAQVRANFNRSAASDINVVGLLARVEHRLGPAWRVKASGGVERVDPVGRTVGPRPVVGGTFASGEIELCREGAYLDLCAKGALASQATGLGTVRRRLSLESRLSYRLSERTTFGLSGNYERPVGGGGVVGGAGPIVAAGSRSLQLRADLDRRLGEHLTFRVHGSYRRREGGLGKADAGYVGAELRWTPRLS